MLRVLYDNFVLIVIAVAAATYVLIRALTRERARASDSPVPGLAPALITGLLGATIVVVGTLVLFPLAFLVNHDRLFDVVAPLFLFGASLFTLAVLIVYAIWPAPSADRAGAVGRALAGVFLVLITVIPLDGALRSQVGREAEAQRIQAEADAQQAILDRSAALSIFVTLVDARLDGPSTHGGHIVTHLSLDIEVRSTKDIDLIGQAPDDMNNWINVSPETVSTIGVQPEGRLGLPKHLAGGFRTTYRLEVPIDGLAHEPDQFSTGPWRVIVSMYGAHAQGTPQAIYRTETTFTVPDRP